MKDLFQRHLALGNTLRFRAFGGSMLPLIRSGDVLHVRATSDYEVGDILLCVLGEQWLAHRLVGFARALRDQSWLCLRGDARPAPDPPVPPESVLGRVVRIERAGRLLSLDGPRGRVCGILAWIHFPWHRLVRVYGALAERYPILATLGRWRLPG